MAILARPMMAGLLRSSSSTIFCVASRSCSRGTTWLTIPRFMASVAEIMRPVKMSSLAFFSPTRRGSTWVPPPPGMRPTRTSVWPSLDVLGGDDDVAGDHQLAARAESQAVDHGHHRLGHVPDEFERPGDVLLRHYIGGDPGDVLGHVGAGAEGFLARAGDHDHEDLLVLRRLLERVHHLHAQAVALGVHGFRAVEGDPRDPVSLLVDDELIGIGHWNASRRGSVDSSLVLMISHADSRREPPQQAWINLVRKYQKHAGPAPTLLYNESPGGRFRRLRYAQLAYENGRDKAWTL